MSDPEHELDPDRQRVAEICRQAARPTLRHRLLLVSPPNPPEAEPSEAAATSEPPPSETPQPVVRHDSHGELALGVWLRFLH